MVDELAAIVRVQAQQRGKRGVPDVVDGAAHPLLTLARHTLAVHPTDRDIHGAGGVEIAAFGDLSAWATKSISRKPGWFPAIQRRCEWG